MRNSRPVGGPDGLVPEQAQHHHFAAGAQGASAQIAAFASENGLTRSMGYTGVCWDAMAE